MGLVPLEPVSHGSFSLAGGQRDGLIEIAIRRLNSQRLMAGETNLQEASLILAMLGAVVIVQVSLHARDLICEDFQGRFNFRAKAEVDRV